MRRSDPFASEALAAVSFDVTGTLIRCPRLGEIYASVLGRHGIELDSDWVAQQFRLVFDELDCATPVGRDRFTLDGNPKAWWGRLITRLCQYADQPEPSRFAIAELYQRFARADSWEIFPDVLPSFARLTEAGLELAVTSNWDPRLRVLLGSLGLDSYLAVSIVSSDDGWAKPSRRIFDRLAEDLHLRPSQIVHVGDHPINDLEGAQAAGLSSLLVERKRGDDLTAAVDSILTS